MQGSGEGQGHWQPRTAWPRCWKQTGSSRVQGEGKRAWSPLNHGVGGTRRSSPHAGLLPSCSFGGASGTPVLLGREAQCAVTAPGKQGSRRDTEVRRMAGVWTGRGAGKGKGGRPESRLGLRAHR